MAPEDVIAANNDPFWRNPFRKGKHGGAKCTTCETRLTCHDCCTCVPQTLCFLISNDECEQLEVLHASSDVAGMGHFNCLKGGWEVITVCDNGYEIDWLFTMESISEACYAVLASKALGLVKTEDDDNRLTQPLTCGDAYNPTDPCRNPSFDFSYGGYTILIRPYETVSLGAQRCRNRGPDDNTGCRCLPRCVCAFYKLVSDPSGSESKIMCWYEDDSIDMSESGCCCNANVMPRTLIGRVVARNNQCRSAAPARMPDGEATAGGYSFQDAGTLVHMHHQFVGGFHQWTGESSFAVSPIGGEEPPETVTIIATLTCGNDDWQLAITLEIEGGDTIDLTPGTRIPSCNPFHIRSDDVTTDGFCWTFGNDPGYGSEWYFDIQEFIGWVSEPDGSGQIWTAYLEHISVAAPPQTLATDSAFKMHVSTEGYDGLPETFKARFDPFSTDFAVCQSGFPWTILLEEDDFPPEGEAPIISGSITLTPANCGAGCGEPPPPPDPYSVPSPCCAGVDIPKTLYLTAFNINDCSCADDFEVELVYNDATGRWEGSGLFCEDDKENPCLFEYELWCNFPGTSNIWTLIWREYPPFAPSSSSLITLSANTQCDPFLVSGLTATNDGCCNSQYAMSIFGYEISA